MATLLQLRRMVRTRLGVTQNDGFFKDDRIDDAINNAIAVFDDKMKFGSSIYGTPIPGWGDTTTQTSNTAPTAAQSPQVAQQAARWVEEAFISELGRAPEGGGLDYWIKQAVDNNWSKEQLTAYIREAAASQQ
jgi:hypothetical protein